MATRTATAEPVVLSDGVIRFGIKPAAGGDVVAHSIDVLLLKMACEEAESAHRLEERAKADGSLEVIATAAFLQDLAGRLQGLGITGCTATVACQLWKQASDILRTLKKNTNDPPSSPSGSKSRQPAKVRTAKSRKGKGSVSTQT